MASQEQRDRFTGAGANGSWVAFCAEVPHPRQKKKAEVERIRRAAKKASAVEASIFNRTEEEKQQLQHDTPTDSSYYSSD